MRMATDQAGAPTYAGRRSDFWYEIENLIMRCKNEVLYISLSGDGFYNVGKFQYSKYSREGFTAMLYSICIRW